MIFDRLIISIRRRERGFVGQVDMILSLILDDAHLLSPPITRRSEVQKVPEDSAGSASQGPKGFYHLTHVSLWFSAYIIRLGTVTIGRRICSRYFFVLRADLFVHDSDLRLSNEARQH